MKVQQFYEEAEEKASDAGKKILPEDMADMAIAMGNSSDWSLPQSAHFDHILITNELFTL